jgi:hypothetical protein
MVTLTLVLSNWKIQPYHLERFHIFFNNLFINISSELHMSGVEAMVVTDAEVGSTTYYKVRLVLNVHQNTLLD